MNRIFGIVITAVLLGGCVSAVDIVNMVPPIAASLPKVALALPTATQINHAYSTINYDDGVNMAEATAIAQTVVMDLEDKVYRVSYPAIEDRGTFWELFFNSLYIDTVAYIVRVNKSTGEVLNAYETDDKYEERFH